MLEPGPGIARGPFVLPNTRSSFTASGVPVCNLEQTGYLRAIQSGQRARGTQGPSGQVARRAGGRLGSEPGGAPASAPGGRRGQGRREVSTRRLPSWTRGHRGHCTSGASYMVLVTVFTFLMSFQKLAALAVLAHSVCCTGPPADFIELSFRIFVSRKQ